MTVGNNQPTTHMSQGMTVGNNQPATHMSQGMTVGNNKPATHMSQGIRDGEIVVRHTLHSLGLTRNLIGC